MANRQHPAGIPATALPVYDRAIARYPHLKHIPDAMNFCRQLSRLAAVDTISVSEYCFIGFIANGEPWAGKWEDGAWHGTWPTNC